jgi:hypothetical protein
VVFWKPLSKLSCVCLLLGKLVNGKHFLVKEKFGLVSRKVFSLYFGRKTLSGSCEKFRNVILFADYIKFGSQTFDCYIYFVLNIFFQFYPLEFDFYINFGPHFYNCYLFFPHHFLIEIFYLSNLVLILLLLLILFEIIYEMVIIIILISSSFNFFICYIWSLLFWLLFILFEIIYKIIFFFNFILIQLFNL